MRPPRIATMKRVKRPPLPDYVPSFGPRVRERVEKLAAMSAPHEQIATELRIGVQVLRREFRNELEYGKAKRLNDLDETLYNIAAAGNTSALKLTKMQREKVSEAARREQAEKVVKDWQQSAVPRTPKLGKKQIAAREAEVAGVGTEWGNDLVGPVGRAN
jgi:hypothetical protein